MKIVKSIFISLLRDADIQQELAVIFKKKIFSVEKSNGSPFELTGSDIISSKDRIVTARVVDPLRDQLSHILDMVSIFDKDVELTQRWLGGLCGNEGENILKIAALSSNWDRLEGLWDLLAERCKNQQSVASIEEINLLKGALSIHNFLWQTKSAELIYLDKGASYNYEDQQRITPKGDRICEVWLPGLRNNAGALRKKTLVATL